MDQLQCSEIFKGVNDQILRELGCELTSIELQAGDILFNQGDPSDNMYLVKEGLLQASIKDGDTTILLGEIHPGEPVGEIMLLTGGRRTASVCAAKKTELIKIPLETLNRMGVHQPKIIDEMRSVILKRLRRNHLRKLLPRFFGTVNEALIDHVVSLTDWISIPRGETLFRDGDPEDGMFLLVYGRVRVVKHENRHSKRVVAELGRGEIVGEMALFTGSPRTATVYAIRDTELVKFTKSAFEKLNKLHPQLVMPIIKSLIQRLEKANTSKRASARISAMALISLSQDVPLAAFSRRLISAMKAAGAVTCHLTGEIVDHLMNIKEISQSSNHDPHHIQLVNWMNDMESHHDYMLYEADYGLTNWTRRCFRQSDQIVWVSWAEGSGSITNIERDLMERLDSSSPDQILVLLHRNGNCMPNDTRRFIRRRKLLTHHHIRWDKESDFQRLGRLLSDRGVGLVLSGGGARGFAHIGVIRALREHNIPIDMLGGTSLGAVIACNAALEWDYARMKRYHHDEFINNNPFRDYTIPIYSLLRCQKLDRVLDHYFKDYQFEDLWVNCFVTSSDLTTSRLVVHREGAVCKAVRASVSIPGITKPVLDNQHLLVDGGVLNNLPADVMRDTLNGKIIAVNVNKKADFLLPYEKFPSFREMISQRIRGRADKSSVPNVFELLARSMVLSSDHRLQKLRYFVDFLLELPLSRYGPMDFAKVDEIIDEGYRFATKQMTQLKDALRFSEEASRFKETGHGETCGQL